MKFKYSEELRGGRTKLCKMRTNKNIITYLDTPYKPGLLLCFIKVFVGPINFKNVPVIEYRIRFNATPGFYFSKLVFE